MNKLCKKCGQEKSLESFNKCAKNKDGLHSYCRDCHKLHYRGNADRHKENVAARKERYLVEARKLIARHLASGCVDCGTTDIRVLEFDHVRGTKVNNVMNLVREFASEDKIVEEIAKCEVRCRNDHAIKTYERLGHTWRTPL